MTSASREQARPLEIDVVAISADAERIAGVGERQPLVDEVHRPVRYRELGQRVHHAEGEPEQGQGLVHAVERLVTYPREPPADPEQGAPGHRQPQQNERDESDTGCN